MAFSKELQSLVLAGKHGDRGPSSDPKGFVGLRVGELRAELHARGVWDTDKPKKSLKGCCVKSLKEYSGYYLS